MAHYYLAESELTWGRFPTAETAARRALTVARGVDTAEPADLVAVLLSEQVLTRALVRRGNLVEAAGAAERLTRRAAAGSLPTLEGLGQGLVAYVTAVAGDTATSRQAGQRAVELASPSERSLLGTATVVWVAHARGVQQRYAEATAPAPQGRRRHRDDPAALDGPRNGVRAPRQRCPRPGAP